ncbi:MAG TPA: IreB family regulatory phosphoprotein [Firmicutes bacterium]|nr:IreB family regulatory phosphoprotein [Candidatus Fermentithermobacillaceae bacterium]
MKNMGEFEETRFFKVKTEKQNTAREIILEVYRALKEKGHNPVSQIAGYLISGDPTYITSHRNARSLVRQIERDEILEELVRAYVEQYGDK